MPPFPFPFPLAGDDDDDDDNDCVCIILCICLLTGLLVLGSGYLGKQNLGMLSVYVYV